MTWTKYSYICTDCDALMEVITNKAPNHDPACVCSLDTFVVRTAVEPEQLPPVISITPKNLVKINSNPYN